MLERYAEFLKGEDQFGFAVASGHRVCPQFP